MMRYGGFAADHFACITGQAQIEITWQTFVGKKLTTIARWGIIGAFKDCSCFIDFVKHRHIQHVTTGFLHLFDLFPEELPF